MENINTNANTDNIYYSPDGNPEIWLEKPDGYFTPEEWEAAHPASEPEPYDPTPEEQLAAFTAAIQARLDAFAQTRNYDSIMSAATYAASTVPKFHAEGQYAVQARDLTWAKGYEIMDAVMAGSRPMPGPDEVLAELPELRWPGTNA